LSDHLLDRFGAGSVFVDVDSIEAGAHFTTEIERAIIGAEAVLVVIGPGWLDARTSSGSRRLDDAADFVRREVEAGLASEVRVVPVLVGGASMPAETELPASIAPLARRNALELQDRRWREDVDALIAVLEGRERGGVGNLPVQPTPFLGRERELAEIIQLLRRQEVRLLTLTGPGGIGKTRLAIQVAAKLAHTYAGGAWFVGLASVTDPDLLLVEVARVLEIHETAEGTLSEAVAARLSHARTLIVLDNLEQLLPDAAEPIAQILASSASLDLLVTTRQRLHVTAEREFALGTLGEDAAVDLFVERARASGGDAALADDAQRQAVAAVCARLDGLPLAIELAAARSRVLDPAALLQRLERRLELLTGGAPDLPARQQTIRATIDWSYDLLPPEDRRLFARLSVFAGGWTLEAAEAVCADAGGGHEVLRGLETLLENSLIHRQGGDGRPRFVMLETVREYAAELLQASGELEELSTRHAEHFLAEAELVRAELRSARPHVWFERLEPELGNFRTAVESSLSHGRVSSAVGLMAALMASLQPCGYIQEARAAGLDEVLLRPEDVRTPERAQVLAAAGSLYLFLGQLTSSRSLLEQAVELARDVDDRGTLALAMSHLGWARAAQGQADEDTFALGEEAVSVARGLDDPWVLGETLNDLSCAFAELGPSPRGVSVGEESLQLSRSIGYLPGVANSLINLGWLMVLAEDYATAVRYLHESLEVARVVSQREHAIIAQGNLALAHLFNGETGQAEPLLRETLRLCREIGDRRTGQETLVALAGAAAQTGAWSRAAWLAGASQAQLVELELAPGIDPRIRERFLPAAREALGHERYEQAFALGRQASFEDAVAYALDEGAVS
jgi:predicted ATPase